MELLEICKSAKEVSRQIGTLDTKAKNTAILAVADALVAHAEEIIAENAKDIAEYLQGNLTIEEVLKASDARRDNSK